MRKYFDDHDEKVEDSGAAQQGDSRKHEPRE